MSISAVNKAYQFKSLADDNIMIGDPADAEFHPKFTLNKWGGECWLKLDFNDSQIPKNQQTVSLVANKVNWSSPLFDFQFYPLTATEQHENGGLEFEIILKAKPQQNTLTFSIQAQGFKFYYQPPLTQEFNPAGCIELSETYARLKNGKEYLRPENVVGSYAVYHDSKRDNQYKTGKAFHIYRPKLTDADSKTAWATLNVDELTATLKITLPQAFLDSAKYPVVVDPTFGYTSIGGSFGAMNSYGWCSVYTMGATAGTADSISWYWAVKAADTTECKLAIHKDSDASRIGYATVAIGSTGWKTGTLASESLDALTVYRLTCYLNSDSGWGTNYAYDSGEAGQLKYKADIVYANEPTDPWGTIAGSEARKMSIYVTYTTGATLQTVTDALSLLDTVLRNKTLILSDSLGLADFLYGNKSLLLGDSASLSELVTVIIGEAVKYVTDSVNIADLVSTPSRVLRALEAIGVADNVVVNKVLQITETVSLAEVVQVGAGGAKKTRLFLILGDLAVQLTGD